MGRYFRLDTGTFGTCERTPQGGLRVPATLTRAGVLTYFGPRGEPIREWRSVAEVAKATSLNSLKGAPLTVANAAGQHPAVRIDSKNYRAHAKGHVGDDVRMDGDKVVATVSIQDEAAVIAVERGMREVSCGYYCDWDDAPGVVPEGEPDAGQSYDRVQRNITHNHLCLVPLGRAGRDVRLRLDAAGHTITTPEARAMEKEIINGVPYDVGTPAHLAACQARTDAERARSDAARAQADELTALRKSRDEEKARADAASAKLATSEESLKAALSAERLDAAAQERATILTRAAAIIGKDKDGKEFRADGMDNAAVKRAAVAKSYPAIKLDGQSPDYVNALWDTLDPAKVQAAQARNDAAQELLRTTAPVPGAPIPALPGVAGPRTLEQVRNDSMRDAEQRSSSPLALSRDGVRTPQPQSAQLETMK